MQSSNSCTNCNHPKQLHKFKGSTLCVGTKLRDKIKGTIWRTCNCTKFIRRQQTKEENTSILLI